MRSGCCARAASGQAAAPPRSDMNARRVESRTGAVAWAIWQHSVSCPRSSNRTCRFPASGFPTSFIVRHTEKSSGRKRPLRGDFSPSPYDTAFSEGSGSFPKAHRQSPSPELRIPSVAAQTRIVSKARIRLDSRKSVRSFKGIICVDISEFESYMPRSLGISVSLGGWRGLPPPAGSMGKSGKPRAVAVQQNLEIELVVHLHNPETVGLA